MAVDNDVLKIPDDAAQCPETRIGYPRVDLCLSDRRERPDAVIFNAEDVEVSDECAGARINDLRVHAA
jgi:hypothetical protein